MKKNIVIGLFLGIFLARESWANSDFQSWVGAFLEQPWSQHWSLFGELQNRTYRNSGTERMLLARVAANYQITPRHTLSLGYGWTPTFHPSFLDEHRLWQQSLARFSLKDLSFAFRFRLEERLIGGEGLAWRWREQVRLSYQVSPSFAPVIWDEFFFNLNKTSHVGFTGFAQNRLFLGARFPISSSWSIEPGYMNVMVRNAGGAENEMNHVATLYFFFKGAWEAPKELPITPAS